MKPEQITAWALDEASAEERQQLEAALLENAQDKQKADETKAFCDFLMSELRDDSLALTDKQRARLVEHAARAKAGEQPPQVPAASGTPAARPGTRGGQTRWGFGVIVRLSLAACAVLGGFWTWQAFSGKKTNAVAVAEEKPGIKVHLAPKAEPKKKPGQGPEARLMAEATKQTLSKMDPQAGKPRTAVPAPAPASAPSVASATPALALKKGQSVMTRGDVEKLKQMQDQKAYALNSGGGKMEKVEAKPATAAAVPATASAPAAPAMTVAAASGTLAPTSASAPAVSPAQAPPPQVVTAAPSAILYGTGRVEPDGYVVNSTGTVAAISTLIPMSQPTGQWMPINLDDPVSVWHRLAKIDGFISLEEPQYLPLTSLVIFSANGAGEATSDTRFWVPDLNLNPRAMGGSTVSPQKTGLVSSILRGWKLWDMNGWPLMPVASNLLITSGELIKENSLTGYELDLDIGDPLQVYRALRLGGARVLGIGVLAAVLDVADGSTGSIRARSGAPFTMAGVLRRRLMHGSSPEFLWNDAYGWPEGSSMGLPGWVPRSAYADANSPGTISFATAPASELFEQEGNVRVSPERMIRESELVSRGLAQAGKPADLMNGVAVTTKAGTRAVVPGGRGFLPWSQADVTGNAMVVPATPSVGMTVSGAAVGGDTGHTVVLDLSPEVTEFDGYLALGGGVTTRMTADTKTTLTKAGAGTVLAGANTYTGSTTINGGVLVTGPHSNKLLKYSGSLRSEDGLARTEVTGPFFKQEAAGTSAGQSSGVTGVNGGVHPGAAAPNSSSTIVFTTDAAAAPMAGASNNSYFKLMGYDETVRSSGSGNPAAAPNAGGTTVNSLKLATAAANATPANTPGTTQFSNTFTGGGTINGTKELNESRASVLSSDQRPALLKGAGTLSATVPADEVAGTPSLGYGSTHNMGALANGGGSNHLAGSSGGFGMNDIQQLSLGHSSNLGPINLASSANYDLFNGGWYYDMARNDSSSPVTVSKATPVEANASNYGGTVINAGRMLVGATAATPATEKPALVLVNRGATLDLNGAVTPVPATTTLGKTTATAAPTPPVVGLTFNSSSTATPAPNAAAKMPAPGAAAPSPSGGLAGAAPAMPPVLNPVPASAVAPGQPAEYSGYASAGKDVKTDSFYFGTDQMKGIRDHMGASRTVVGDDEITATRKAAPVSGESYTRIIENEMKEVAREPLSTLSIDVDTASYANVRRFLNQNMIPPPDAVRIEELINYFPTAEEGPAHEAKEPFAVRIELAPCPWQPVHRLARIAIKGREMDKNRKASNLVFLVDVSGSMDEPAKLPLVQQSLRMLTEQLGEGDRVTMVVYAGNSGVVLPPTNGEKKGEILAAINRLQAGGSTHGSAGIKLAYEQAVAGFIKGGVNRVILCTDGDFNVGVSSPEELEKLIKHKAKTGVFLSVLGFGTGNLKDRTMETLADKGNGNYAYIDSLSEARKVLVEQMSGTLDTIAKDVKIQVEFNPALVRSYRLIGYENRLLAKEDFNDDKKDAGEIGAGHSVVALYEIVPTNLPAGAEPRPAVDSLKYQAPVFTPAQMAEAAKSGESMTVKLRYKAPDSDLSKLMEMPVKDEGKTLTASSEEYKFSAAVAGFGLLLRDSAYKGTLSWETVRRLAIDGKGADKLGYRGEFLQLIDKARGLKEVGRE